METYSILEHFSGSAVLLTGASGYTGGLVLERLLRSTDVSKVFVLLRKKHGEDIQARLHKVLASSPVFHLLRDNVVLDKVVGIAGDMTAPNGLGISPSDRQLLQAEVDTVIHCAADIRLEMGIQELLRANFEGTRQLLELAGSCRGLAAFVHVSSAYVNMNATPGSLVHESIYSLSYGDQPVNAFELVQELLSMPAHNANLRAEGLLAQWGFPNNYTLSKHLAEYMVADYQAHFNLPVAIVRPTLISSVARDPYPGYTGNYAGHVGATLAFMAGLFDSPAASNYKATNVWDVIPSDVVANVILAAAAAVGAGVAGACRASPLFKGPSARKQAGGSSGERSSRSSDVCKQWDQGTEGVARSQGKQGATGRQEQLLIIHCGSSTTYPLTIMESWNWGVEVYGAWPMQPNLVFGKCAGPLYASHEPNPSRAAYHIWLTGLKIWLAAKLLTWAGKPRVARKLTVGFDSFKVINQPKTDVNLRFSSVNMQRLAGLLCPSEQDEFLLLWRPQAAAASAAGGTAGSTSTPAATAGLTATAQAGLTALAAVKAGKGVVARQDSDAASGAISAALDTTGRLSLESAAASDDSSELSSTYSDTESNSGCGCGSEADAGSVASIGVIGTAASSCAAVAAAAAAAAPRRQPGAVLTAAQQAEVTKMRSIPIEWRSFHISLGAFLYCSLFQMPLPAAQLPIVRPEVVRWLKIKPADLVITHQFKLYK